MKRETLNSKVRLQRFMEAAFKNLDLDLYPENKEEELWYYARIHGIGSGGSGGSTDLSNLEQRVYSLEHPYYAPSLALTADKTLLEKGTTQDVIFTANITKGRDKIKLLQFIDKSTSEVLDEIANPESLTQTYTKTLSSSFTMKSTVNDGTKDISKELYINFVAKSYYGLVAASVTTPTADQITGLTGKLNSSKAFTYSGINASNQKVVFAYPKSFGTLSKILDANNFDYINSYNRQELTINSEAYYVYIMKDATSISGGKQIYS